MPFPCVAIVDMCYYSCDFVSVFSVLFLKKTHIYARVHIVRPCEA